MKKTIHAITLNYRRADLTTRCVESLAGQVDYIWIVDNSENLIEGNYLIKKVESLSIKVSDTQVKVVSSGKNLGFSKGLQFGIEKACAVERPDFFLLINNDATAGKKMVEHMLGELPNSIENTIITPKNTNNATPSRLWYNRVLSLVLKRYFPGSIPYLSGACILVPEPLVHPFLFDPEFFMYGEDVELSWRLSRAGVKLKVTDADFQHDGSESSRLGSPFYEYQVVKGHILLSKKLAKGPVDRIVLSIGRMISLPLRASIRSFRYRSFTPWWALLHAAVGTTPPNP